MNEIYGPHRMASCWYLSWGQTKSGSKTQIPVLCSAILSLLYIWVTCIARIDSVCFDQSVQTSFLFFILSGFVSPLFCLLVAAGAGSKTDIIWSIRNKEELQKKTENKNVDRTAVQRILSPEHSLTCNNVKLPFIYEEVQSKGCVQTRVALMRYSLMCSLIVILFEFWSWSFSGHNQLICENSVQFLSVPPLHNGLFHFSSLCLLLMWDSKYILMGHSFVTDSENGLFLNVQMCIAENHHKTFINKDLFMLL